MGRLDGDCAPGGGSLASQSVGTRTLEITKELLVRRLQRGVSDVLLGKGKPGCVCLCSRIIREVTIRAREILSLEGFVLIELIFAWL